jgi:hypothetical protein
VGPSSRYAETAPLDPGATVVRAGGVALNDAAWTQVSGLYRPATRAVSPSVRPPADNGNGLPARRPHAFCLAVPAVQVPVRVRDRGLDERGPAGAGGSAALVRGWQRMHARGTTGPLPATRSHEQLPSPARDGAPAAAGQRSLTRRPIVRRGRDIEAVLVIPSWRRDRVVPKRERDDVPPAQFDGHRVRPAHSRFQIVCASASASASASRSTRPSGSTRSST